MFLLPGLVITTYITGAELKLEQKLEIKRYLRNRANPDGGWGLYAAFFFSFSPTHCLFRHIEGKSTIFGTAMNYVAYRLIGGEVDDPTAAKARKFLLDNGTAL
jgi:lanosterol synthase